MQQTTDWVEYFLDKMKAQHDEHGYASLDYDDLVATMPVEVVERRSFGSYQGDLVYFVRQDGRYGFLIFGYGSCSGCDSLQAAQGYIDPEYDSDEKCRERLRDVVALRDRLEADILWQDEGKTILETVGRKIAERGDWWYYDPEIHSAIVKMAAEVTL